MLLIPKSAFEIIELSVRCHPAPPPPPRALWVGSSLNWGLVAQVLGTQKPPQASASESVSGTWTFLTRFENGLQFMLISILVLFFFFFFAY